MKLSSIHIKIISYFLVSNILAFIAIMLLPAEAKVSNPYFLSLINLLFIVFVIVTSLITYIILPKEVRKKTRFPISDWLLRKNIKLLITFPIIGMIFIGYDRIFLRGIDYTQGLRTARYAWLDTTGGSFFGVFGNLIIPFAYVGIFFLIIYYRRITKAHKFFLIISIIFGVVGHAALNGGRSNLLLALVMVIISMIFREKGSTVKQKKSLSTKLSILLLFGGGIYYVGYITSLSASMGNISMGELVQEGTVALYGIPNKEFYSTEHFTYIYFLIYFISYLYHGQWTAEISYSILNREGSYSIPLFLNLILEKVGLGSITGNEYFGDTGAFVSLPGSFYYDGGFLALLGLSIFLGLNLGIAFYMLNYSKNISAFKMIYIMSVLYIMFLSPIIAAYGLSYFRFIMIAFILLGLINKFVFKKKINFI